DAERRDPHAGRAARDPHAADDGTWPRAGVAVRAGELGADHEEFSARGGAAHVRGIHRPGDAGAGARGAGIRCGKAGQPRRQDAAAVFGTVTHRGGAAPARRHGIARVPGASREGAMSERPRIVVRVVEVVMVVLCWSALWGSLGWATVPEVTSGA